MAPVRHADIQPVVPRCSAAVVGQEPVKKQKKKRGFFGLSYFCGSSFAPVNKVALVDH